MATEELELLSGTVDLLVLRTLAWGPQHGFAIAKWIKTTSDDMLRIEDRALYLALHRLEERGLVESEWGLSENNRKAKYYRITTEGRRQLRAEASTWTTFSLAVSKVLTSTTAPA